MSLRIQMKVSCFLFLLFAIYACGDRIGESGANQSGMDSAIAPAEAVTDSDFSEEEFDTFYVVIVDTAVDYFTLRDKMLQINQKLHLPVDTMGRFFNETKNLIALPDDDEDEIFAGEYYPRRFPSESMSLEYLSFYNQNAGEKTIALVSGIYETETAADSAMRSLSASGINAFKIKSVIYTGCMH